MNKFSMPFAEDVLNAKRHDHDIYTHFGAEVIPHKRMRHAYRYLPVADRSSVQKNFASLQSLTHRIEDAMWFAEKIAPKLFWTFSRGQMNPKEPPFAVRFFVVNSKTRRLVKLTVVEGYLSARVFIAGFIEACHHAERKKIETGRRYYTAGPT